MKQKIKKIIKNIPLLLYFFSFIYNMFFSFKFMLKSVFDKNIHILGSFNRRVKFSVSGNNNIISVGKYCFFNNLEIVIKGSNNTIIIEDECVGHDFSLCLEDDNNLIHIGSKTWIGEKNEFSVMEGTKIMIGNSCLFASGVKIRTGDSHSIISMDSNSRINYSNDVKINNKVWICENVRILKGSKIGNNVIIGANSCVTKSTDNDDFVLLIGSPAKILRRNVSWKPQRIVSK